MIYATPLAGSLPRSGVDAGLDPDRVLLEQHRRVHRMVDGQHRPVVPPRVTAPPAKGNRRA